jgi:hypothetical protein
MNVITDITAQELTQVLKPILQGGRVADLLGEISRLEGAVGRARPDGAVRALGLQHGHPQPGHRSILPGIFRRSVPHARGVTVGAPR